MDISTPQYQELRDDQLWARNRSCQRIIGESKPDPWYWNTSTQVDFTEENEGVWRLEMNWVKWFCDHACLDQYKEEIEILEAEFTRICQFHQKMHDIWLDIAQTSDSDQEPGYAAYAHKQAAMYQTLKNNVIGHWLKHDETRKKLAEQKEKSQKSKIVNQQVQDSMDNEGIDAEDMDDDKESWLDLDNYVQEDLQNEEVID
ncbi:hypothetical protein Moror_9557 [Moniliophthora roreri MCA 2997]|uniref:Uncharacterized protein n=1 Tax=Moniliophthora roreri (strain MCA 2997) TaxID=1381753 RepID=V2YHH7_MONRO|nr:hypothetical protein Moror_9557 [Moniliophthora roreri MCA 2997]